MLHIPVVRTWQEPTDSLVSASQIAMNDESVQTKGEASKAPLLSPSKRTQDRQLRKLRWQRYKENKDRI